MVVYLLYLRYVSAVIGVYDSEQAVQSGIDLLVSKYPNTFTRKSFEIRQMEINKTDVE